jgi:hypothetical protein
MAMKVAAAGGADVIGGCAKTVFCAISFHFVTSLACATEGNASAASAAIAASQIRVDLMTPPFS